MMFDHSEPSIENPFTVKLIILSTEGVMRHFKMWIQIEFNEQYLK